MNASLERHSNIQPISPGFQKIQSSQNEFQVSVFENASASTAQILSNYIVARNANFANRESEKSLSGFSLTRGVGLEAKIRERIKPPNSAKRHEFIEVSRCLFRVFSRLKILPFSCLSGVLPTDIAGDFDTV